MGLVNDKTCQELPVVEVLQGGHQAAAGTHLGHATSGKGKQNTRVEVPAGLAGSTETTVLHCRITQHCSAESSQHRDDPSQLRSNQAAAAGLPPGSGITHPKAPHPEEISVNLNYLCQETEKNNAEERNTISTLTSPLLQSSTIFLRQHIMQPKASSDNLLPP